MKIVVFTDIHGSFNSLIQLFSTDDFKNADKKIFLGDVVVCCSRPNQCVTLLKNSDCICLLGNNDMYVVDHIPKEDYITFSPSKLKQIDWMKANLSEENKRIISSWPRDYYLPVGNKKLYFTHYAWEHFNNDTNVVDTPKIINFSTRKKMFENIDADYIFFGHEHISNYHYDDKKHFFCIGTLGLRNPGCYLLIDIDNENMKIEEKFINFDIKEEINLMDIAGYPYNKKRIDT